MFKLHIGFEKFGLISATHCASRVMLKKLYNKIKLSGSLVIPLFEILRAKNGTLKMLSVHSDVKSDTRAPGVVETIAFEPSLHV